MAGVGITYLIFEQKLLADFSSPSTPKTQKKESMLSRALIGIQVRHEVKLALTNNLLTRK